MGSSGAGGAVRRIFSIAGYALSFGLMRMETILRVAWLPVTLLLILQMAHVFTVLSIATGRPISFADVSTYGEAQQALSLLGAAAWMNNPELTASVLGAATLLEWILIASFMAPLIRYAGLGERPSPGVVKLPFGMDQIRFVVGYNLSFLVLPALLLTPMAVTAAYVVQSVDAVAKQYFASFPDPESLHTVTILTGSEILEQQGKLWMYTEGVPLAAAAPAALLFWFILFRHFRPRRRLENAGGEMLLRAIGTFVVSVGVSLLLWFAVIDNTPEAIVIQAIPALNALFPGIGLDAARAVIAHLLVLSPVIVAMLGYASLRALPYSGIAVSRRSFAFAGLGRVTRGWRLIWTLLVAVLIYAFVWVAQHALNFCLGLAGSALNTLLIATQSASRLANSGETAEWIYPTFLMGWNITIILANIFWLFFTYGVFAGLLGRLYRESEIEEA